MEKIYKYSHIDWLLFLATIPLLLAGLITMRSFGAGSPPAGGDYFFSHQLIWITLGLIIFFLFSFIDWRFLRKSEFLMALFLLSIAILASLLIFGKVTRGAASWFKLHFFSLEPADPVKIILILVLAKYFSRRHIEIAHARHIIVSSFYVAIPAILVFFQPDFGSIIILIALWLGVLIVSGIKLRHFLILSLSLLLVLSLSWLFLMKDYQKERVISFIMPVDPLGVDWSQNQAKIAIGAGGIFGQGLFKGSQTQYGFLPEPQTDFIFAAIAEEMGLIGVSVLLLLFLVLIWRIFNIAVNSQSNFPRLFSVGLIIVLISQIFIHIGMNLGILPIIGISLPFISYGGSGLIMFFACLGILESIKSK